MKVILFLKAYFVVAVISFVYFLVDSLNKQGASNSFTLLNHSVWLIALIGLYSYAYKKNVIDNPGFWSVFLIIYVAWEAFSIQQHITTSQENISFRVVLLATILYVIVKLPEYVSIYLLSPPQNRARDFSPSLK
jgi:hypothetical protein